MDTKSFLLAMLLFTGVDTTARGDASSNHQPHSESYWRKRIAQAHRGMKRSAVEKILPVHSSPQEDEVVRRGHYSFYAVDSEWMVKVPYDFHGFVEDPKKNPHQLMHLYCNRVVGQVKLVHQYTDVNWILFPPTQ